jgi:hypothetical protein
MAIFDLRFSIFDSCKSPRLAAEIFLSSLQENFPQPARD